MKNVRQLLKLKLGDSTACLWKHGQSNICHPNSSVAGLKRRCDVVYDVAVVLPAALKTYLTLTMQPSEVI